MEISRGAVGRGQGVAPQGDRPGIDRVQDRWLAGRLFFGDAAGPGACPCPRIRAVDTVRDVVLAGHAKAHTETGAVFHRHPGEENPGQFDDREHDQQEKRQNESELNQSLGAGSAASQTTVHE